MAVLLAPTASIARHDDHRTDVNPVRWFKPAASSAPVAVDLYSKVRIAVRVIVLPSNVRHNFAKVSSEWLRALAFGGDIHVELRQRDAAAQEPTSLRTPNREGGRASGS